MCRNWSSMCLHKLPYLLICQRSALTQTSLYVQHMCWLVFSDHVQGDSVETEGAFGGDVQTSLVTLEDEPDLQSRYPHAPAWGQAVFQEGRYV
jgi:hypothetical protein